MVSSNAELKNLPAVRLDVLSSFRQLFCPVAGTKSGFEVGFDSL